MSITNFTANFDLLASQNDGDDEDLDADIVALVGTVTFTPQLANNKPILAPDFSPRPAGLVLLPFTGYVGSDGRLRAHQDGPVGVRLWANDPVLNLENLYYKVEFNLTTQAGRKVRVDGGFFEAPSTDTEVNLVNVLTAVGSKISGIVREQSYAEDIMDSGSAGRSVVRADTAAEARAALDVLSSLEVYSREQTVGTADNLPNESGFWWTSEPASVAGKVYMGTTAEDRGSWLQEWTQPVGGGPFWLHRYFMGYTDVVPADPADLGRSDLRDDHNPVQCAIKAGKPVVAFWSGHGANSRLYYRISDQNVDAAEPGQLTFGPTMIHDVGADERTSYSEVMIHGNNIWVAHRTGYNTNKWSLTKFPDWATGTPVQHDIVVSPPSGGLSGQCYVKARVVGDSIRFITTDHPTTAADNKLWWGEVDLTNGDVTKADGTVLGNLDGTNLPLEQSSLETVFTSSGAARPWSFDVGYGATREIAFVDGPVASFNTDGKYKYARYADGSWTVSDVCTIGSFFGNAYFPSITFVPDEADTVLLARSSATGNATSGTHFIEKWTTTTGTSWTNSVAVDSAPFDTTGAGDRKAFTRAYPVRVESGSAPFDVIGTDIIDYPTYYKGWVMRVRPLPLSHPVKRVPEDSAIQRGLAKESKSPEVGLYLPGTSGTYIQGPDIPIPVEGIRLEMDLAVPDWTPATQVSLFSKESTSAKREGRIWLSTVGRIGFYYSEDGTTSLNVTPNEVVPFSSWQRAQIAVEFIPSHEHPFTIGATQKTLRTFYRFSDDEPWVTLAASQTASGTTLFSSDSPWEIGSRLGGTTELAAGVYYRASVMTVGGETLAEWRADRNSNNGVQVDSQGNTWEIKSSGQTIASPTITNLKTDLIRDPATNIAVVQFGTSATNANPNPSRLLVRSGDLDTNLTAIGAADVPDISVVVIPKGDGAFRVYSAATPKIQGWSVSGTANLVLQTESVSGAVEIVNSNGALGTLVTGSIQLGHATDTTITRSAAGLLAVEGVNLATVIDAPMDLAAGEATMRRRDINLLATTLANGQARFTYFMARRTEVVASVRTIVNTAQVGATLARIGVWEVNPATLELTLVGSSDNDTGLWSSTGVSTKALSASFTKTRGKVYAVGLLVVGTSTAPQFSGSGYVAGAEAAVAPRQSAVLTSQTDLTSTIADASLSASGSQFYAALVP